MSAIEKTKSLGREDLPVSILEPDMSNPNKMKPREFDLLCDNMERTGITDPILVRPIKGGRYRIVGGHHRWEAAKYLEFETVPCTIITDPDFDDEAAAFQLVRMNVIRGKMDPQSFFALYEKMSGKYTNDMLQEMFGFAETAEFKKLITQTANALPADMQAKFKEAAKEIKTIDGLAKLLNEMFTKHGSSLPFGYMVFDYGGHRSVWLQVSKKTIEAFGPLGDLCREKCRTVDDLVGEIVQSIAAGGLGGVVDKVVAATKPVVLPPGYTGVPTTEDLKIYSEM
jgi:ParB/RepB/Spo0J family partition protein